MSIGFYIKTKKATKSHRTGVLAWDELLRVFLQTPLKLHGPVVTVVRRERLCSYSDSTQTESCLFFLYIPGGKNDFSEHDLKTEPFALMGWLPDPERCGSALESSRLRKYCRLPSIVSVQQELSYFIDVSWDRSWSRRCCLHLERVVFVLREEEGLLMQRNGDLRDKFFSQVTK